MTVIEPEQRLELAPLGLLRMQANQIKDLPAHVSRRGRLRRP